MGKCYIHLAEAFMVILIIIHITNAKGALFVCLFVGLPYQGTDIVFRFIIEYSSLDFGPLGNNNRSIFIWGFLKDDIFWLMLKLEISYRVIKSSRKCSHLLKEWSIIDKGPRIGYSLELACRVWNQMRTGQGPYLYGIEAPVRGPYELDIPLMKLKFWPYPSMFCTNLFLNPLRCCFSLGCTSPILSTLFSSFVFILFCFFGSKCIGFNFPFNLKND